jgi:cathepsin L
MKSTMFTNALATLASAERSALAFESFVQLHGRSYQQGSAEFEERKALYEQRIATAEAHNVNKKKTWTAGVNKFWDWTETELHTLRGWDGAMMPEAGSSMQSIHQHSSFLQKPDDFPKERDWVPILETLSYTKDQGNCGSCWAITAETVLEAHHELYSEGDHRIFSTQQIVDCTPNPKHCGGDGGCKGATAELAMEWVLQNGIGESKVAAYTAKDGKCSAKPSKGGGAAIGMVGWETLPNNKYEPLMRALAELGPVAVSVMADQWFMYEGGVFDGCGKDAVISHAVTAVGYGEDEGIKYWNIQNSWGEDWGEEGHIRLLRHDTSSYCGMNNDPQKGIGCKGETKPVPVCGMCGVLFDSVVPHFKGKMASKFKLQRDAQDNITTHA